MSAFVDAVGLVGLTKYILSPQYALLQRVLIVKRKM